MRDSRQTNLDDLIDIYRVETSAQSAAAQLLNENTRTSSLLLAEISRSTDFGAPDFTGTDWRKPVDALLDFYGVLEIAMLIDYVPDPLPEWLKSEVLGCLQSTVLTDYYERDRDCILPVLLKKRLLGQWSLKERDIGRRTTGCYQSFLSLQGRVGRDAMILKWVQLLDKSEIEGCTIDDVCRVAQEPSEYLNKLVEEPKLLPLGQAVCGFQRFIEFCNSFEQILQQTADSPYLQSAIWHFYKHWFGSLGVCISFGVREVAQQFLLWRPQSLRQEAQIEAINEMQIFVAETVKTIQRLTSDLYGKALTLPVTSVSDDILKGTSPISGEQRSMNAPTRSRKRYLFTSESVTEGHPDKIADQISDAIVDACLVEDPLSRVACETLTATGLVLIAGEITTKAFVDLQQVVRGTVQAIGYDNALYGFDYNTCAVISTINRQSPDIAMGVDVGGAGDQGMMFGYACNETDELMPAPIALAHKLTMQLSSVRRNGQLPYLRPDGKSQVTVEYDANGKVLRIDAVVISTQHAETVSNEELRAGIMKHVIQAAVPTNLLDDYTKYHINPTGRFVIGGPMGDTGLTGRKIIVDTYGGMGRHGGGAFSGKDPTKVDRSGAYMARHIAKNLVAAGLADRCEVQLAYAIGVAEPVSVLVETFGTAKVDPATLPDVVRANFKLTPVGIIESLELRRPMYRKTASYGHFGRKDSDFTWEKIGKATLLARIYGIYAGARAYDLQGW